MAVPLSATHSFEPSELKLKKQRTQYDRTECLSNLVTSIIKKHFKTLSKDQYSDQYTNTSPGPDLKPYVSYILKATQIDLSTLAYSLFYIDHYLQMNSLEYLSKITPEGETPHKPRFLTEHNVHRLFVTATLVAILFNEDNNYNIEYYSRIFTLFKEETIRLKIDFLFCIDFSLLAPVEIMEYYEDFFKKKF